MGQREVEIAPSSDKEEAAVAASARALAGEMASDPDGCFGESELFRFARSLGDGKLVVSGDKVLFSSLVEPFHSFRSSACALLNAPIMSHSFFKRRRWR